MSESSSTSEVESRGFTRSSVVEVHGVGESVDGDGVGFVTALLITDFIFGLEDTARANTDLSVDDASLRIVAHLAERSLVDGIGGIDADTAQCAELTWRATRIDDGLAREGRIFFRQALAVRVEDVSGDAAARTIIRLEDTIAAKTVATSRALRRSGGFTAATAADLSKVGIVEADVATEAGVDGTTGSSVVEAAGRARSGRRASSWAVVSHRTDVTLVDLDAEGIPSVGSANADVTGRAGFAPERVGGPESSRAGDTAVLSVEAENSVVAGDSTGRAEQR